MGWVSATSNNKAVGQTATGIAFTFTPTTAVPATTGKVTITASAAIWTDTAAAATCGGMKGESFDSAVACTASAGGAAGKELVITPGAILAAGAAVRMTLSTKIKVNPAAVAIIFTIKSSTDTAVRADQTGYAITGA